MQILEATVFINNFLSKKLLKILTTMFYAFATGMNKNEREQKSSKQKNLRAESESLYDYDGYGSDIQIESRLVGNEADDFRYPMQTVKDFIVIFIILYSVYLDFLV